ncbi:MAG TPA: response regulator [Methylomirabilota bacterium]|jgi:CheY-like chemotaxis protein|nr:response regulator [Methylomirabilota bacterium]
MSDLAVILLVEDREDDVVIIRRAFSKGNILNPLFVVRNGDDAIAYLSGQEKYSNRQEYPLPDLILLDLKMPGKDGFDVLRWLRKQPGLNTLRVVVLTSSEELKDVNLAYQLGANSFLVKPVDFENFVKVGQALRGYWLWLNKPPEAHRPGDPKPGSPHGDHTGTNH